MVRCLQGTSLYDRTDTMRAVLPRCCIHRTGGATENAGPENAGLENDGLEFDGPEQRAVMSLVQEHVHTLKNVPISLCRHYLKL